VELKPGVRCLGLKPELLLGLLIAERLWREQFPGEAFVITALVDSTHHPGSLHYAGQAADIRIRDLSLAQVAAFSDELKRRLWSDYDVVIEDLGTDNRHLHLEYQPKEPL
jgi:hypothetical protein